MFVWLLLACGSEPPPLTASDIAYGDTTVAAELLRLSEQQAATPTTSADGQPSAAEVLKIEERLVRLELALVELQGQGVMPAKSVGYDPSISGLSGRTAQEALDDIGARLVRLERSLGQDMGQAGSGLGQTRGGMQGGQMGMQGGGMQGGGMQGGQGGGMQGGGMQGGQGGGMQGGQGGGMQGGGMQGGGMQGGR